MKIQLLSDLHLEFEDLKNVQNEDADVIVLAGDIHVGTQAIDWIEREFTKPVIYVLGNHEFYGNDIATLRDDIKTKIKNSKKNNIHHLENETIEIDGIHFFGATFWTDYNLFNAPEICRHKISTCMNDYFKIKNGEKLIITQDILNFHNESLKYLKEEIDKKHERLVVVSHHAPTINSCLFKFRSDDISAAYASDLSGLLKEGGIDLWLHGHVHNNVDYRCYSTRVVSNPRGYSSTFYSMYPENTEFDKDMLVEIY